MSPHRQSAAGLMGIREDPLSLDEVSAAVLDPSCGAVVVFLGIVRNHDHGHDVTHLDYSAHPSALDQLEVVAGDVHARWPDARLAAVHRVGQLAVGDIAVVVAAAAPHRDEAFGAARDLIDTLKAQVPIWKHQRFVDGSTQWVGLP